ncbi:hypothetical protein ElyMa_005132400 [Elysia marginata]|uniref:Uncharacterized protein n=1 Tax=Elysia marginata TaxID=1093978 RepID=A0AAV4JKP4_9GAST|nr:hypothetical protein ElyMa_005132400 [Elysia marginata]
MKQITSQPSEHNHPKCDSRELDLNNIQKVGLTADYKDKGSETGRWLKMFFAMPALQADEVENCFTEVLIAQAPTEEAADKFADYNLHPG